MNVSEVALFSFQTMIFKGIIFVVVLVVIFIRVWSYKKKGIEERP